MITKLSNPLLALPDTYGLDSSGDRVLLLGVIIVMTQLNLFHDEEPEKKPIIYTLPDHHKATGTGDFNSFLEIHRNNNNTFVISGSPIYLYQIDDIEMVKGMLFKFDKDVQEWVHKPVYNFRINQLLHYIYDYLNERSENGL